MCFLHSLCYVSVNPFHVQCQVQCPFQHQGSPVHRKFLYPTHDMTAPSRAEVIVHDIYADMYVKKCIHSK